MRSSSTKTAAVLVLAVVIHPGPGRHSSRRASLAGRSQHVVADQLWCHGCGKLDRRRGAGQRQLRAQSACDAGLNSPRWP